MTISAKLVQRSKRRLSNPRTRPSSSSGRINRQFCRPPYDRLAVWCWVICITGVIFLVNLQTLRVSFQTTRSVADSIMAHPHQQEQVDETRIHIPAHVLATMKTGRLPPLPEIPMPPIDSKTRLPLNYSAMNQWAEVPLVGSFSHYYVQQQSDGTSSKTRIRIHMPFVDLQMTYKGQPPQYHRAGGGGAMPLLFETRVTHNVTFASSDCVVLTRKGNKFAASGVRSNQDRIGISDDVDEEANGSSTGEYDFWMGLFDGHGDLGHVVAHFAITEFPKRLHQIPTTLNTDAAKEALKQLFLAINANMPYIEGSGSTGISIWKRRNQLFVSNVGDSMAFVVSVDRATRQDVKVIYTTKPHKPNDPIERRRIERMGGEVQAPPSPEYSWRLLIPIGPSPLADVFGLAMSRSLGDFEGQAVGLIAEPTTDVIQLDQLDPSLEYLVIAATDGLLDRINEIDIAREMAASRLLTPTGKYLPLEAAERLILQASRLWMQDPIGGGYRDDISLAVHRLRI